MKYLLLLAILPALLAADSPEECYEQRMVDAIVRSGGRTYVFETYKQWDEEGNPGGVLERDFNWVFRAGTGELLNDAEALEKVGQEDAASRLRESYLKRRKNGTVRLAVGIPLGIAMSVAGGMWMANNFEVDEPSALDQAGSVVVSIAGVGVSVGALLSFLDSREVKPSEHDITSRQALDVLDRHNNAARARCGTD